MAPGSTHIIDSTSKKVVFNFFVFGRGALCAIHSSDIHLSINSYQSMDHVTIIIQLLALFRSKPGTSIIKPSKTILLYTKFFTICFRVTVSIIDFIRYVYYQSYSDVFVYSYSNGFKSPNNNTQNGKENTILLMT